MANRLAHETSPYLLQHADNPVDWWPWSEEAFVAARQRGVAVHLSVGYSSCHWCHVLARESFEDEAVAAFMNEHFVNIKVDREERPDVDAVYMEAVQAATGQGGWPMTVFLTPDAEPFYFGTYFPPEPRSGMPSFQQVLEGVRAAWADRRDEVAEVAGKITRDLAEREVQYGGTEAPGEEEQARALLGLTREYDAQRGGFGGAPKFPPSMVLEFLLRHGARTGAEGRCRWPRTPVSAWPGAGSTTSSAAASPGTPSTGSGLCPISRRCCMTMHFCVACTPTSGVPPAPSSPGASLWRPPTSWCANSVRTKGVRVRARRRQR